MKRSTPVERASLPTVDRFAERYTLHELLGEGGMAKVHRATDLAAGREVALKQLTVNAAAPERTHVAALFEREFHTLAQLNHPHVIEVYDYGLRADGASFYTMELLDGGDLRERSPLPWSEACKVTFGICSALALLHSRRLLHRDVTPRNIRCTQAGIAKLIDFGAMTPMTEAASDIVGTPAFTAPEVLQRIALDARTDLYSLGITLYYALTARVPYRARTFTDLLDAWKEKPVAPSAIVSDVPAALDDLVLSLINVEPALRPASAFEVMQRLAACAGLHVAESAAVSRAYLSTPTLVGRSEALAKIQNRLRESRQRGHAGVLIQAGPGVGRSRLLDACVLDAVTQGFTVSRATATGARNPFAVARRLVRHILDALPRIAETAGVPELFGIAVANENQAPPSVKELAELPAGVAQDLLRRFFLGVSCGHPLVIAVDDVHKIDEPSAALLAELLDGSSRGGILIALTTDSEAAETAALRALARRCEPLPLEPLSDQQTRELLASLFSEVANLGMLSEEIYRVARGNPSQTLELAQHLADRGVIRYASGGWTLPDKLSADDLPKSASAAMRERISRFGLLTRFLAQAQALAFYEEFTDDDYRALLPAASAREVDIAVSELLEAGALIRDGAVYRLTNRVWSAAFLAELDEEETKARHRALASMYEGRVSPIPFVHHAFSGGLDEKALGAFELNEEVLRDEAEILKLAEDGGRLNWCYPRAVATARRLGRPLRHIHNLRRWQYLGSVASRTPADRESAQIWFEQIARDAGLDLYRNDTQSQTTQDRLTNALMGAQARHLATPENERVYSVEEAIRKLGEYVLIAVVDGARSLNSELLYSLPDILEPYVPLSPLLEAIWLNMRGSREGHCNFNYLRSRELWRETLQKVDALGDKKEGFVDAMRNAVMFALGSAEVQLGLASATALAERLDSDAFQRISALNLRKIVRLEQGDANGAEKLRRQAEVLSLQLRMPPMFHSSLTLEVFAYAKCNNLAGLTETIQQIKPITTRYPNWAPLLLQAEGQFEFARGDYEAALAKFEACVRLDNSNVDGGRIYFGMWVAAQAGRAECLLALGRAEDARLVASEAVAECEARGAGFTAADVVRVLALAEAKLGDPRGAERLEALIAQQTALGATGLRMGLSYEARAQIAIWSGDSAAFERFAELTAREYRHGARTALGARYERLMNEAARAGMQAKLTQAEFQALAETATSGITDRSELVKTVTRTIGGYRSMEDRAQFALQVICTAWASPSGYLFLVTPAGPVLRASRGESAPAPKLTELVTQYVAEQRRHVDQLDDMATEAVAESATLSRTVQIGGRSYELLPLQRMVDEASVLAAVVVIEVGVVSELDARRAQLLPVLAASLVRPGEGRGVQL
jgi:hypothetical protein